MASYDYPQVGVHLQTKCFTYVKNDSTANSKPPNFLVAPMNLSTNRYFQSNCVMLPFSILISTIEKYYSTSIETAEQYNDTLYQFY